MSKPRLEDCVKEIRPWSGKPVSADSLTHYRGRVVGFCNPGCRDKFEQHAWCDCVAHIGSLEGLNVTLLFHPTPRVEPSSVQ